MDYYSFNRPRRDGWLSWPCWLTDSRCLTHKVVTRPAISLAQDRESSPARTGVLTTMLRNQLRLPVSFSAYIMHRCCCCFLRTSMRTDFQLSSDFSCIEHNEASQYCRTLLCRFSINHFSTGLHWCIVVLIVSMSDHKMSSVNSSSQITICDTN